MYRITVGDWRQGDAPMLIVSGPMGKEKVHYEAPPSSTMTAQMEQFLHWANNPPEDSSPLVNAAIAHLWFVAIHPFDDGNGRLARTITDMLITRKTGIHCYSVSAQMLNRRKEYYALLESTSCGGMDITDWIVWFLHCIDDAIKTSEQSLSGTLQKSEFWSRHSDNEFNERQRKIINRLFDGFSGPLTSSKWAKICHCSPDTALRDITALLDKGILVKEPSGGRSTHYTLVPQGA